MVDTDFSIVSATEDFSLRVPLGVSSEVKFDFSQNASISSTAFQSNEPKALSRFKSFLTHSNIVSSSRNIMYGTNTGGIRVCSLSDAPVVSSLNKASSTKSKVLSMSVAERYPDEEYLSTVCEDGFVQIFNLVVEGETPLYTLEFPKSGTPWGIPLKSFLVRPRIDALTGLMLPPLLITLHSNYVLVFSIPLLSLGLSLVSVNAMQELGASLDVIEAIKGCSSTDVNSSSLLASPLTNLTVARLSPCGNFLNVLLNDEKSIASVYIKSDTIIAKPQEITLHSISPISSNLSDSVVDFACLRYHSGRQEPSSCVVSLLSNSSVVVHDFDTTLVKFASSFKTPLIKAQPIQKLFFPSLALSSPTRQYMSRLLVSQDASLLALVAHSPSGRPLLISFDFAAPSTHHPLSTVRPVSRRNAPSAPPPLTACRVALLKCDGTVLDASLCIRAPFNPTSVLNISDSSATLSFVNRNSNSESEIFLLHIPVQLLLGRATNSSPTVVSPPPPSSDVPRTVAGSETPSAAGSNAGNFLLTMLKKKPAASTTQPLNSLPHPPVLPAANPAASPALLSSDPPSPRQQLVNLFQKRNAAASSASSSAVAITSTPPPAPVASPINVLPGLTSDSRVDELAIKFSDLESKMSSMSDTVCESFRSMMASACEKAVRLAVSPFELRLAALELEMASLKAENANLSKLEVETQAFMKSALDKSLMNVNKDIADLKKETTEIRKDSLEVKEETLEQYKEYTEVIGSVKQSLTDVKKMISDRAGDIKRMTKEVDTINKNTKDYEETLKKQRQDVEKKIRSLEDKFLDHNKKFIALMNKVELKQKELPATSFFNNSSSAANVEKKTLANKDASQLPSSSLTQNIPQSSILPQMQQQQQQKQQSIPPLATPDDIDDALPPQQPSDTLPPAECLPDDPLNTDNTNNNTSNTNNTQFNVANNSTVSTCPSIAKQTLSRLSTLTMNPISSDVKEEVNCLLTLHGLGTLAQPAHPHLVLWDEVQQVERTNGPVSALAFATIHSFVDTFSTPDREVEDPVEMESRREAFLWPLVQKSLTSPSKVQEVFGNDSEALGSLLTILVSLSQSVARSFTKATPLTTLRDRCEIVTSLAEVASQVVKGSSSEGMVLGMDVRQLAVAALQGDEDDGPPPLTESVNSLTELINQVREFVMKTRRGGGLTVLDSSSVRRISTGVLVKLQGTGIGRDITEPELEALRQESWSSDLYSLSGRIRTLQEGLNGVIHAIDDNHRKFCNPRQK